jgi:hypothetical protein
MTAKSNFALSALTRDKADSERLARLQGHKKLDCAYDDNVRIFAPVSQSCEDLVENYYARHNSFPGKMPGQAGMISADNASNFKVHVVKLSRQCACLCRGDFKSFDLFLDLVSEARCSGAVDDAVIKRERKRDHLGGFIFIFVWN